MFCKKTATPLYFCRKFDKNHFYNNNNYKNSSATFPSTAIYDIFLVGRNLSKSEIADFDRNHSAKKPWHVSDITHERTTSNPGGQMMRMMPLKANLSIVISRYKFDFFSLSRAVTLYSKLWENETLFSSDMNFFERLWSLNLNSSNFNSSWAKIFWIHSFVEKRGI